jgi:hypothetical protein
MPILASAIVSLPAFGIPWKVKRSGAGTTPES